MARETFYITTPIYYVNDLPHIGHVYTTVVADATSWRVTSGMCGDDVRFLTGTDEHGQKIESAARRGAAWSPRRWRTGGRAATRTLWRQLEITNDDFIRTTDAAPPRRRPRAHPPACRPRATSTRARTRGGTARGARRSTPRRSSSTGTARTRDTPSSCSRRRTYFFRLSAYQEPLLALYRRTPRVHPSRDPLQRGRALRRGGPQGPLDLAGDDQLGDPVARRPGAHRLRLARRADELHLGSRLRLPATQPCSSATGRRRCTWSARTSCASTASTGRRS